MRIFVRFALIILSLWMIPFAPALAGREAGVPGAPVVHSQMDSEAAKPTFLSICYHNIEDDEPDQSRVGVSTSKLVEQFSWLQHNGYHPVSIDDILAAKHGKKPLPDKAVLLTFDDGYESAYTRVFPVLKAFHYPAVVALVGSWLKETPDHKVQYGDVKVPRSDFLTWPQIREMSKSGLVEIGSHSYDQHMGISANPQNNTEPAMVTPQFNPKTGTYETPEHYKKRLYGDARAMADLIEKETGKKPRVMVWPYGEYNYMAVDAVTAAGMPITLTLDDGPATLDKLMAVPRYLINADPNIESFVIEFRDITKPGIVRAVQIDLDYVYDPDPKQQEENVGRLVQRIHDMNINAVFLQAFADPKGTGLARETYFPNRYLPMRADLFNRISWQLQTRADVKVFAWLPLLSYDFSGVTPVTAWNGDAQHTAPDPKAYHRLSPFDPVARKKILNLYEDLARNAPIDGLLFHDDALLSDFEDASAPAMKAYTKAGFPDSIDAIRADPQTFHRWTQFKTKALIDFTHDLRDRVSHFRAPVLTVRNIYAEPVLDPASQDWYAQDLDDFLKAYDYTALMAMPDMENVDDSDRYEWLNKLVAAVASKPQGLQRTIFELQSVDWRKQNEGDDRQIPTSVMRHEMRMLESKGALNLGYYPDDFVQDHPNAQEIHGDFSLNTYPYEP